MVLAGRLGVEIPAASVADIARELGGNVFGDGAVSVHRVEPSDMAGPAAIAPALSPRYVSQFAAAVSRGAVLLVEGGLLTRKDVRDLVHGGRTVWVHRHAVWALARLLQAASFVPAEAEVGEGAILGPNVVLYPGVKIGKRVRIDPGCVIGRPGFGWATGPTGDVVAVPQLGGVVIEDDVTLGALSTVDAGTLGPTFVRAGAKLDAHCHVAHNCDIGEGVIVAAQSGFAGSVRVGRFALIGGQVGVADHVTIGERAKIAAKSGVIGDVPNGATFAGYPAVDRWRWLRGMAKFYARSPRAEA